jgi:outer membrane receptor protein involved in Fe transport
MAPLRTDVFDGEYYDADFRVTGVFGNLPGGPLGIATGIGVRMDRLYRDSDQLGNAGETATLGVVTDWGGRQKVQNIYVEFALPVADTINLQIAARYEDYGDFDNLSPKIAGLWQATDNLVFRASWSQSFKAPGIVHLASETQFNGANSMAITYNNVRYGETGMGPYRGAFRITANPLLTPQESENISIGFDFNATDNISFGAAWVSLEFTDKIVNPNQPSVSGRAGCYLTLADGVTPDVAPLSPQDILDGFTPNQGDIQYNGDPNSPTQCVNLIDPALPPIWTNQNLIFANPINAEFLNVEAVDLRANMFWDTGIGQVSFTPNVSIFTKYDYPNQGGGFNVQCPSSDGISTGVCDGVGRTTARGSSGIRPIPRWQGTFQVGLNFGNQNLRLTPRYTDGINPEFDDLSQDAQDRFVFDDGLWTVDLNWAWQFSANASISASVRNMFATEPDSNSAIFNRNRRTYSFQYLHSFAN